MSTIVKSLRKLTTKSAAEREMESLTKWVLKKKLNYIFKPTRKSVGWDEVLVYNNETLPLVVSPNVEAKLKRNKDKLEPITDQLEVMIARITHLSKKELNGPLSDDENTELLHLLHSDTIDNKIESLKDLQEKIKRILRKAAVPKVQSRKKENANWLRVIEGHDKLDKTERPNTEVNSGSYNSNELAMVVADSNKAILAAPLEKPDGRGRIGPANGWGGNKKVTKKNRRKNRRYSRRRQ